MLFHLARDKEPKCEGEIVLSADYDNALFGLPIRNWLSCDGETASKLQFVILLLHPKHEFFPVLGTPS